MSSSPRENNRDYGTGTTTPPGSDPESDHPANDALGFTDTDTDTDVETTSTRTTNAFSNYIGLYLSNKPIAAPAAFILCLTGSILLVKFFTMALLVACDIVTFDHTFYFLKMWLWVIVNLLGTAMVTIISLHSTQVIPDINLVQFLRMKQVPATILSIILGLVYVSVSLIVFYFGAFFSAHIVALIMSHACDQYDDDNVFLTEAINLLDGTFSFIDGVDSSRLCNHIGTLTTYSTWTLVGMSLILVSSLMEIGIASSLMTAEHMNDMRRK